MRLLIEFSPPARPLPFDHLDALRGVFHAWSGLQADHDGVSLYGFSWLHGAQASSRGVDFPRGATWHIGAWHEAHGEALHQNALADWDSARDVLFGMRVRNVAMVPAPRFEGGREVRRVLSPVWVKSKDNPHSEGAVAQYLTFDDPSAEPLLTRIFQFKLECAGLSDPGARCDFAPNQTSKTKLARIHAQKIRASACPVSLEGSPDARRLAWTCGVGHGTGLGFGFLA